MAARPSLTKEDVTTMLPVWNEHTDKLRGDSTVPRAQLSAAMKIEDKLNDFLAETPEPVESTEPEGEGEQKPTKAPRSRKSEPLT